MEKVTVYDRKIDVIKQVLDKAEWSDAAPRNEYILVLKQIACKGVYDSDLHGLIYSFWKMHSSERLMNTDELGVPVLSYENAWDILRELNLGDISLPKFMRDRIRYTETFTEAIAKAEGR